MKGFITLKILLKIGLLLSTILLLPQQISRACTPAFTVAGYTFINPEIIAPPVPGATLSNRYVRFSQLYQSFFEEKEQVKQNANLQEWMERFCSMVEEDDMAYLIYKASSEDLELLLTATKSKSLPVPVRLRDNSFAQYLRDKKCTETIEYLLFAKRCEPHVAANGNPWVETQRDTTAMSRLIAEGKKHFKKTKSDYIRLRYAFQLVRLAHYAKQYSKCLKLYDELTAQIDKQKARWNDSILPWWILGHKAGALRATGNRVEAAYLYTLIYMSSPERRASAFRSFLIKTDEEWKALMNRCISDTERAYALAIRASDKKSKSLDDLQQIYTLDPRNDQLEALLVKEIDRMELHFLGLAFNPFALQNKRVFQIPGKGAEAYLVSLLQFTRKVVAEKKVRRPLFWKIAEAYLTFLAGDNYAAEKVFEELEQQKIEDHALKEQLAVIRLVMKIAGLQNPNDETEAFIANLIRKDSLYRKYPDMPNYVKHRMAQLYQQHGHPGKAFLCINSFDELKANPKMELLDDLLQMASKKEKNAFERMLLKNLTANDLLDIKASLYMANGELEAAYETYRRMSATNWDDYGLYNIFKETTKDCIRCYQNVDTTTTSLLNKGELLEKLIDLDYKTRANIGNVAMHHYQLGLAFYNMSYFGYAWKVMDYSRSGATWNFLNKGKNNEYCFYPYPNCIRENTDLSKALYHFQKARLLAGVETELGAKAAFQAARCEQKIFFASEAWQPPPCCNNMPSLTEKEIPHYQKLKEQFSSTNFYQQIIAECKYFAAYARKQ